MFDIDDHGNELRLDDRISDCGFDFLRLRWFPFLVWAIGGSDLTLCSHNGTSVYAPNHSRVKTALQGFYAMERLETAVISGTLTGDLPERLLDAAERSPQRDLSVSEMTHINDLLAAHV